MSLRVADDPVLQSQAGHLVISQLPNSPPWIPCAARCHPLVSGSELSRIGSHDGGPEPGNARVARWKCVDSPAHERTHEPDGHRPDLHVHRLPGLGPGSGLLEGASTRRREGAARASRHLVFPADAGGSLMAKAVGPSAPALAPENHRHVGRDHDADRLQLVRLRLGRQLGKSARDQSGVFHQPASERRDGYALPGREAQPPAGALGGARGVRRAGVDLAGWAVAVDFTLPGTELQLLRPAEEESGGVAGRGSRCRDPAS